MRRSLVALVAGMVAVASVAAFVVLRVQRDREWAHGGDHVKVDVEVVLANQETFEGVVVGLGVPPGKATRFVGAEQSVVVRVTWSDAPRGDGWFQLVALDGRVAPPRPLAVDGGWNSDGATGSNWAGAYEALADHYEWLRGVAADSFTDVQGITEFPAAAVDARAVGAGTVTAWFRQWGEGRIPFVDPSHEIALALVYVDDQGEVRWARRVFGAPPKTR